MEDIENTHQIGKDTEVKTERNRKVAMMVMIDGAKAKDAAEHFGISCNRVLQIVHKFCKEQNREVYERRPSLPMLREHAEFYFPDEARK